MEWTIKNTPDRIRALMEKMGASSAEQWLKILKVKTRPSPPTIRNWLRGDTIPEPRLFQPMLNKLEKHYADVEERRG